MFPFDDVIMDVMKVMEVLQWQASKFNEVMFSPLALQRGIEAIQDLISHGLEFPWQEVENYAGISMLHKEASFFGLATKYLRYPGGRFATIIILWWKINDGYIYIFIYIYKYNDMNLTNSTVCQDNRPCLQTGSRRRYKQGCYVVNQGCTRFRLCTYKTRLITLMRMVKP